MPFPFQRAVEARDWLHNNPNDSALAANRFGTTARALEFVEALYARGATQVLIDDPDVDSTGLSYGDTLVVRFDENDESPMVLQEFCEEEGPGDVPPGDFTMHVGSGEIRLWWD